MCSLFKKPKVVSAPQAAEPGVLRNPYLDGLDAVVRARSGGVRALTIRKATPGAPAPTPALPAPAPVPVPTPSLKPTPNPGGGSGGKLHDMAPTLAKMPGTLGLVGRTILSKA